MLHNELSLVERLTGIYKPPLLVSFPLLFFGLLKLITEINFGFFFVLFSFFLFFLTLILSFFCSLTPLLFTTFTISKGPSNPSPLPSTPNTNIWNLPTTTQRTTTTTERSTTTTTTTRRAWTTKSPFYNPSNPSYGGGGNYFGNRYGDDSIYGGGASSTKSTTKRPSSSSGSSFLSGFSSFLSGDGAKILKGFLGSGGSGSGSSGGFGSLFGDSTRPLQENKNYRGGLFSENSNTNQGSQNSNSDYSRYPVTRLDQASAPSQSSSSPSASHGSYGWKLS